MDKIEFEGRAISFTLDNQNADEARAVPYSPLQAFVTAEPGIEAVMKGLRFPDIDRAVASIRKP